MTSGTALLGLGSVRRRRAGQWVACRAERVWGLGTAGDRRSGRWLIECDARSDRRLALRYAGTNRRRTTPQP